MYFSIDLVFGGYQHSSHVIMEVLHNIMLEIKLINVSLASRPFASAFMSGQGGEKVWRLLTRFHGLQECNQSICHMISPRLGSAAVTTSLFLIFGGFVVCKVQIKYFMVQCRSTIKVEATTLGLADSTDLQTPVSATEGSFLCLSYFE